MNAEPVTNEQPAQVGALSRPPAPLQWNPAPPGAMVMSKQAAGSQQETLAQLPTARTPFFTGLSWQQRATSPDPPLHPSLVELALPHPSTKRTSVPGMACAGSMCVWPRPGTHGRGEEEIPACRTSSCQEPAASCSGVRAPASWGRCPGLSPIDMALLISWFSPSSPSSPQPKPKPLPLSCLNTGKAAMNIAARDLLLGQGGWQSKGWCLEVPAQSLTRLACLPEQG